MLAAHDGSVDQSFLLSSMRTYTFQAPAGLDSIEISTVADGWGRISGTANGVVFPTETFKNYSNVIIDLGAGDTIAAPHNDTVTIAGPLTATALRQLSIKGGNGSDKVDLYGLSADNVVNVSVAFGSGGGTLGGAVTNNDWTFTAPGAGTVRAAQVPSTTLTPGTVTFTGVTQIYGGSADDRYSFGAGILGSFSIDDSAGGSDTIDLSLRPAAVTIDLAQTSAQVIDAGLSLALPAENAVDNVVGTPFADTISGNDLDNILAGFGGSDVLVGRDGNDTYDLLKAGTADVIVITGGTGGDTVVASDAAHVWNLTAAGTGELRTGTTGRATFTGVTSLFGGTDDDSYHFAAGNLGGFSIDDAGGVDTIDFSARGAAVAFDLSNSDEQKVDPTAGSPLTLTLAAVNMVDNVVGTIYADTLTGNELDNRLEGFGGGDHLSGGYGDDTYVFANGFGTPTITEGDQVQGVDTIDFTAVTADVTVKKLDDGTFTLGTDGAVANRFAFANIENLVGGTGVNSLDFTAAKAGVVVDLAGGTATDFAVVSGFRNVTGSAFADRLIGDDNANRLSGLGGADTLTGNGGDDWIDGGAGRNRLVESRDVNFTLTTSRLQVTGSRITGTESDTLAGIVFASLTGGTSDNVIDASGFAAVSVTAATPLASLNGGTGVNVLANDLQVTLTDGTSVSVNLANATTVQNVLDSLQAASPRLSAKLSAGGIELRDVSQAGVSLLRCSSTSSLASDLGLDTDGIAGVIAGSGLGGGVALDGSGGVALAVLNQGTGVRRSDQIAIDLETSTPLSSLNSGDGVRRLGESDSRPDFQITLTDGKTVDVKLRAAATTVQDVIDAITTAAANTAGVGPGRLTVSIDATTYEGLRLSDAINGGSTLAVSALNGSPAAADLGIADIGDGPILKGGSISNVAADLRVMLADGTTLDIDLSGATTVADVLDRLNGEYGLFTARIDAAGEGLVLRDLSTGAAAFRVISLNTAFGSHAAEDLGITGTSVAGVIHGTSIVGGYTPDGADVSSLDDRYDNDVLRGTSGDDTFTAGGYDTIFGGAGIDTVVAARDTDFVLKANDLDATSDDLLQAWDARASQWIISHLTGVEQASLTGGDGDNTIDASGFTRGSVSLIGGDGRDILRGGTGDDFLSGGTGADQMDGGAGTNTVLESDVPRAVLSGTTLAATLDIADGLSQRVEIRLATTVTGGTFRLSFRGATTAPISYHASGTALLDALERLGVFDKGDVVVGSPAAGAWNLAFVGKEGARPQTDVTADSTALTGGLVTVTVATVGTTVLDTLVNIQRATISGTADSDLLDAHAFSGSVSFSGRAGDDVLIGTPNADTLLGGYGDDRITGNGGGDVLDGGVGLDAIIESLDADLTLTNTRFTVRPWAAAEGVSAAIAGFEFASLTGGDHGNVIDASGFTGLNPDSPVARLDSGKGLGAVVNGADLEVTLTNGTTMRVSLGVASTLHDVFDTIHAASAMLTASLDADRTAIVIHDSSGGNGILSIKAANGSLAGARLGIVGSGVVTEGGTIKGTEIAIAKTYLSGGGGVDFISGSPGDDTISGGAGADFLGGGPGGCDTLVESRDVDFTLTTDTLTATGGGIIGSEQDVLAGFKAARLTGGESVNTIDAGGFAGSVVLATGGDATHGGNLDVLKGPSLAEATYEATYVLNVVGMTAPVSSTDTARQVRINEGRSTGEIRIVGGSTTVAQSSMWWANISGGTSPSGYAINQDDIVLQDDIVRTDGGSIALTAANTFNSNGKVVRTSTNGKSGDITITAKTITIGGGSVIEAGTEPGPLAGAIRIEASDTAAHYGVFDRFYSPGSMSGFLGFYRTRSFDARVTIDDATIRGGTVLISGKANTVATDASSWSAVGQKATDFFTALSLEVGISKASASATIDIGANAATTINAHKLTITTVATALGFSEPIAFSAALAYAASTSDAEVHVGQATITTTNDCSITARADSTTLVTAFATNEDVPGLEPLTKATGRDTSSTPFAVGIAAGDLNATSSVSTSPSSVIQVGGNLNVLADTVAHSSTVARGQGDAGGRLALGIAWTTETCNATAAIEGTITVGGSVDITAQHHRKPIETSELFGAIPRSFDGTVASAVLGTTTTGNTLDDFGASRARLAGDAITSPVKTARSASSAIQSGWRKLRGNAAPSAGGQENSTPKVSETTANSGGFSGAIAYVDATNHATATIGNAAATPASKTIITAGGSVTVSSSVTSRPIVNASSSVNTEPGAVSNDGSSSFTNNTRDSNRRGLCVSGSFGSEDDEAVSYIYGNVALDAGGALKVDSRAINAFDSSMIPFANIFSPYAAATFTLPADSGIRTLRYGDTVDSGGSRYQFVGASGSPIDLSQEDFTLAPGDGGRWTKLDSGFYRSLRTFGTYLQDDFGLAEDANMWTQSRVSGPNALAGAVSYGNLAMTHGADAEIKSGAIINADRPADAGERSRQTVSVTAKSENDAISLGGNFKSLSYGRLLPTTTSFTTWQRPTTGLQRRLDNATPVGVGNGDTGSAVGAVLLVYNHKNTATATIEDGVALSCSTLDVTATNDVLAIAAGVSAGQATAAAGVGVVMVVTVDNTTTAAVGAGAVVTSDDSVTITATDDSDVFTGAGGVTAAERAGFGGSVAYNRLKQNTRAYVGNADPDATVAAPKDITITAGGVVSIQATNSGIVLAAAVAGAKAAKPNPQSKSEPKPRQEGYQEPVSVSALQSKEEARSGDGPGISYSGIPNGGAPWTHKIYGDFFSVDPAPNAPDQPDAGSSPQRSRTASAWDLAVSYAHNTVTDTAKAWIDHAAVKAGGISLVAESGPTVEAAAIGGAFAGGRATSRAIAGALSTNSVDNDTEAFITNCPAINDQPAISAAGSITIRATDSTTVMAQAGSLAASWGNDTQKSQSSGSVGLSVALNWIGGGTGSKVLATIENSTVTAGNAIEVAAKTADTGRIWSLAVSGAGSKASASRTAADKRDAAEEGGLIKVFAGAGAGAVAWNSVRSVVHAGITGSVVTADGQRTASPGSAAADAITVTAQDLTDLIGAYAFGIAAAYSQMNVQDNEAESFALGIGIAGSTVSNALTAQIDQKSSVTASGKGPDTGISLQAKESASVSALGIGLTAAVATSTVRPRSTGGLSLAGSAAWNTIDNTTEASIAGGSAVTASNGGVSLQATDDAVVRGMAGTLALDYAKSSGGKTITPNTATAIAAGLAIVVNDVGQSGGQSVEAFVDGSTVTAARDVTITAASTSAVHAYAVGGGAAVSKSIGTSRSFAAIGSVSLNTVKQTIDAPVKNAATISTAGKVALRATDSSTVWGLAGSITFSSSAGGNQATDATPAITQTAVSLGAAVSINSIQNDVHATIESSTVKAGSISLVAESKKAADSTSDYRFGAQAYGVALSVSRGFNQFSGGFDLAAAGVGSFSGNSVDNDVEASIRSCRSTTSLPAVESTVGGITIEATDDSSVAAKAGGLAIGVAQTLAGGNAQFNRKDTRASGGTTTAVGGAVGVSIALNSIGTGRGHRVEAFIDDSAVHANEGVSLSTISTAEIDAWAISGAIAVAASGGQGTDPGRLAGVSGISFAGSGAATVNSIAMDVHSRIGKDSAVSASAGNVEVTAADNSKITATAGAGTLSLSGAFQRRVDRGLKQSNADGGGNDYAIALGASVALNTIRNDVTAEINAATVQAENKDVVVKAVQAPAITATAVAASIAAAWSGKADGSGDSNSGNGVSIGGGGAYSVNSIIGVSNAVIQDSVVTTKKGDVHLSSGDSGQLTDQHMTISATVVGVDASLTLGFSNGQADTTGGAVGIGVAIARNSIGYDANGDLEKDDATGAAKRAQVQAYVSNSQLTAGGQMAATTLFTPTIDAEVDSYAVAANFAGSENKTTQWAGAGVGAEATSRIAVDVKSYVSADSTTVVVSPSLVAGSVSLTAIDTSTITSRAHGGSLALVAAGKAGATLAIGVSLARNEIDNDVEASIKGLSTCDATSASPSVPNGISLTTKAAPTIDAAAVAVSAAGSFSTGDAASGFTGAVSGAGAESTNVILGSTTATIASSTVTSEGDVTAKATLTGTITAHVDAVSLAVAGGQTGAIGVAIGAGVARNLIGFDGDGRKAVGVTASVDGASITAEGLVSLDAESTQTVNAYVNAVSVALAGSTKSDSIAASGSGVLAENRIATDVESWMAAPMDAPPLAVIAKNVSLAAHDTSTIDARAYGVSVAGSWSPKVDSGALSIGVSLARNQIASMVDAHIRNLAVTAKAGSVDVTAIDEATITAHAAAVSIAAAWASAAGIALSGAGAEGTNIINNKVRASVSRGIVTASNNVTVAATSSPTITAFIGAFAGALGIGENGAAGSLGVSLARNLIGLDSITDDTPWDSTDSWRSSVTATIEDSTVTATTGTTAVTALANKKVSTASWAGSVAVAVGSGLAGSAAGAGAEATSRMATQIVAKVDDSDVTTAADLQVSATDLGQVIASRAFGVAVSAAFAPESASIAIGASKATAEFRNDLTALITSDTASHSITVGGDLSVKAISTPVIIGVEAVAVSVSASVYGASGGGISLSNTIANTVTASIDGPVVVAATGSVEVVAEDNASLAADAVATTVAVSIGAALGISIVSNKVQSTVSAGIGRTDRFTSIASKKGDITIDAQSVANVTKTRTVGVAASSLAGVEVNTANVTIASTAKASTKSAALTANAGRVTVRATGTNTAHAEADGGVGGGIAAGAMIAGVHAGAGKGVAEVTAEVGDGSIVRADAVKVAATAIDDLLATSVAGAVGAISGLGCQSTTYSDTQAAARLGDHAHVTSRTFALQAVGNHSIDTSADAYAFALAAGFGAGATNENYSQASIDVGDASVSADAISIQAFNTLHKDAYTGSSNVKTGGVGFGTGSGIVSATTLGDGTDTFAATVTFGSQAELAARGTFTIETLTDVTATDALSAWVGSLLGTVGVVHSTVTANTRSMIDLGGASLSDQDGDLLVAAHSNSSLSASTYQLAISLQAILESEATATDTSQATIRAEGANLLARNVLLYSGLDTDGLPGRHQAKAHADTVSEALFSIPVATPRATISETNQILLGTRRGSDFRPTRISSLRDVTLSSVQSDLVAAGDGQTIYGIIPWSVGQQSVSGSHTVTIDPYTQIDAGIDSSEVVLIKPVASAAGTFDTSKFGTPLTSGEKQALRTTDNVVLPESAVYVYARPQVDIPGMSDGDADAIAASLYSIQRADLPPLTLSKQAVGALLLSQLRDARANLQRAADANDSATAARYAGQADLIEGELEKMGVAWSVDANGEVLGKEELVIALPDIDASPGSIFIESDAGDRSAIAQLRQDGRLTAAAAADLRIVNQTPFAMKVGTASIFDDTRVRLVGGTLARFTPGNIYFNAVSLATEVSGVSTLTIVQHAAAQSDGQIAAYPVHPLKQRDLIVQGNLTNATGLVSIHNDDGGIVQSGTTIAGTIDIYTPFDLTLISADILHSNIDPQTYVDYFPTESGIQKNPSGYVVASQTLSDIKTAINDPTHSSGYSARGAINIVARGFNVDGLVRSGSTNVDVTIPETVAYKKHVACATTAALAFLSGLPTIDGYTVKDGDRVLVKDQTDAEENGIYVVNQNGAWTRSSDADTTEEVYKDIVTYVTGGATNGGQAFRFHNTVYFPFYLGHDPMTFTSQGPDSTALLRDLAGVGVGTDGFPVAGTISAKDEAVYLDDIVPTPGSITIVGQVFSTGNGNLQVAAGFLDVRIENLSGYKTIVNRIDAADNPDGRITIIDTDRTGGPLKKEYVFHADGTVDEKSSVGSSQNGTFAWGQPSNSPQHKAGENVSFQPETGLRYQWVTGQSYDQKTEEGRRYYYAYGFNGDEDVRTSGPTTTTFNEHDLVASESVVRSGTNEPYDINYELLQPTKRVFLTEGTTVISVLDWLRNVIRPSDEPYVYGLDYTYTFYRHVGPSQFAVLSEQNYSTDSGNWQPLLSPPSDLPAGWQGYPGDNLSVGTQAPYYYSQFDNTWHTHGLSTAPLTETGLFSRNYRAYSITDTVYGIQRLFTHSLKADYPIALTSTAHPSNRGAVSINSRNDLVLRGIVATPANGLALLTSSQGDVRTEGSGAVLGALPTVSASHGSVSLTVDGAGGGLSIDADGNVRIAVALSASGHVLVESGIKAGGDVFIDAPYGMQAAGPTSTITCHILQISSDQGGIGTIAAPLAIDTRGSTSADVYGFAALASGDIFVMERQGDLPLVRPTEWVPGASVESLHGDVRLQAAGGSILDAWHEDPQVTQQEADALDGRLTLSGDQADTSAAKSISSEQIAFTQAYHNYWRLERGLRSGPNNAYEYTPYDAAAPLQHPNAIYNLEITRGGVTAKVVPEAARAAPYDPNYTWTGLTDAEKQNRKDAFKRPANQLLSTVARGVYTVLYPDANVPTFAGDSLPNLDYEQNNVSGNNVKLVASGDIGRASGLVSIDLSGGFAGLTDQQRQSLASASVGDIVGVSHPLYRWTGGPGTVSADASNVAGWQKLSAKWSTSVNAMVTPAAGDIVLVQRRGEYGLYEWVGSESGGPINLQTQDYGDETRWQKLEPAFKTSDGNVAVVTGSLVEDRSVVENVTLDLVDDVDVETPIGFVTATAGRDVSLHSDANLNLDAIAAGGDVRLRALNDIIDWGSLISGTPAAIATLGSLGLSAGGRIGGLSGRYGDQPLRIQVGAPSGLISGAFTVEAGGAVSVRQIDGGIGAGVVDAVSHPFVDLLLASINAGGEVTIESAGSLFVQNVASNLGAGRVTLDAAYSIVDGSKNEFGKIRGSVVELHAGADIGAAGTGAVPRFVEVNLSRQTLPNGSTLPGTLYARAVGHIWIVTKGADYTTDVVSSLGPQAVELVQAAFKLANAVPFLYESQSTANRIKVADIRRSEEKTPLVLTGADKDFFAIDGDALFLIIVAPNKLDYETKTSYSVTINAPQSIAPIPVGYTLEIRNSNEAPAGAAGTVTTLEDTAYQFTLGDFPFSDPSDPRASNTLKAVKITTLPTKGSLTNNGVAVTVGAFIPVQDITDGRLVFSPVKNGFGPTYAGFTFQIQDDGGTDNGGVDLDPTPRLMTIAVTPVNDAPVGAPRTVTAPRNLSYVFAAADFGLTDPDDAPAGNALSSVTIVTLPALGSLTNNGVAVAAGAAVAAADINSGKLRFTPVANATASPYASFSFKVQDDGGKANGGVDTDVTARTMTINVSAANNAPVGAASTVTCKEDLSYAFKAADFPFSDPRNSPANTLLAVKITTLPAKGSLTFGTTPVTVGQVVTVATMAQLKFTPVLHATGVGYTTFTFQVQDNGGTASGGVDLDPTPRTMTIDVLPVNHKPVGVDNTVTILEDARSFGAAGYAFKTADFPFVDAIESHGLLAVKITTLPTKGSLIVDGKAVVAGQFVPATSISQGSTTGLRYIPAADGFGTAYATFTFQVRDNGGTLNGGVDVDPTPRKMTINVTSVNDAPVGTAKTVTTLEDRPYVFTAASFGFTDPRDVPKNTFLAVQITSLPLKGTLTLFNSVTKLDEPLPPYATVSVAAIASGGLKFKPSHNASGVGYARFTFQVKDNGGTANGGVDLDPTPRTMTINVTSVNDAPTGKSKTVTMLERTLATSPNYTFTTADFGFADPNDATQNGFRGVYVTVPQVGQLYDLRDNGAPLATTVTSRYMPVADIAAGRLQFKPARHGNGSSYASFTFRVRDNGGVANGGIDTDSSPKTMTINVTPANSPPVGTTVTIRMTKDSTRVFAIADFGFTDPSDSPANKLNRVKIASLPTKGSLTIADVAVTLGQFITATDISLGKLKYKPAAGGLGAPYATFTFRVEDDGASGTGNNVNLDITPRLMTINVA